jgi:hypothetical protein
MVLCQVDNRARAKGAKALVVLFFWAHVSDLYDTLVVRSDYNSIDKHCPTLKLTKHDPISGSNAPPEDRLIQRYRPAASFIMNLRLFSAGGRFVPISPLGSMFSMIRDPKYPL